MTNICTLFARGQSGRGIFPLLASALLLASPMVVLAGDLEPLWKTVEGWQVRVDRTLNNGCFMYTAYEGGSLLRIGIDNRSNATGYMMIGNQAWQSLEAGKDYQLVVQFDNESPWQGTGRASTIDTSIFLYIPFDQKKIMEQIQRKQAVSFTYNGKLVTKLKLKGTYSAMQALTECQASFGIGPGSGASARSSDPFAGGRQPVKADPFQ